MYPSRLIHTSIDSSATTYAATPRYFTTKVSWCRQHQIKNFDTSLFANFSCWLSWIFCRSLLLKKDAVWLLVCQYCILTM